MEVKLESRTHYLHATLIGPLSLEGILQAFQAAYDVAFGRGSGLILFDCSGLDGKLSSHDRLTLGESGAAYWSSRSWRITPRIAVVGNAPVIDGFAALVASNRGVNALTFSEVQEALDWLGIRQADHS